MILWERYLHLPRRAALPEYARRHELEIGAVYEEIVSGESIEARPKMKLLLQEVAPRRWAGVLCMDIDRLARGDSADQAQVSNTFRISQTPIITPARVCDQTRESDEEYVDFELFMARREYKAISRRGRRVERCFGAGHTAKPRVLRQNTLAVPQAGKVACRRQNRNAQAQKRLLYNDAGTAPRACKRRGLRPRAAMP